MSIIALSGCYSNQIANKYIDKLYIKNPKLLEYKSNQYYPKGKWLVVKMTPEDQKLADSLFSRAEK